MNVLSATTGRQVGAEEASFPECICVLSDWGRGLAEPQLQRIKALLLLGMSSVKYRWKEETHAGAVGRLCGPSVGPQMSISDFPTLKWPDLEKMERNLDLKQPCIPQSSSLMVSTNGMTVEVLVS